MSATSGEKITPAPHTYMYYARNGRRACSGGDVLCRCAVPKPMLVLIVDGRILVSSFWFYFTVMRCLSCCHLTHRYSTSRLTTATVCINDIDDALLRARKRNENVAEIRMRARILSILSLPHMRRVKDDVSFK